MLLVEEPGPVALAAGFDPPLLFNLNVCVRVRRQEPLQELFARLTQLLGAEQTTLPSPHAQRHGHNLGTQEGCRQRRQERASLLRSRIRPPPSGPLPARQVPPGCSQGPQGVGCRGTDPMVLTGCRWEMCYGWGCCACRAPSIAQCPLGPYRQCWGHCLLGLHTQVRRAMQGDGIAQGAGMATPGLAPLSHRCPQGLRKAEPPPKVLRSHPRQELGAFSPTPCTHAGQDLAPSGDAGGWHARGW